MWATVSLPGGEATMCISERCLRLLQGASLLYAQALAPYDGLVLAMTDSRVRLHASSTLLSLNTPRPKVPT